MIPASLFSPLFSPEEADRLIKWLDCVDTLALPRGTMKKLKKLVAMWATDPEMVIV